jgi:hypothetical protein
MNELHEAMDTALECLQLSVTSSNVLKFVTRLYEKEESLSKINHQIGRYQDILQRTLDMLCLKSNYTREEYESRISHFFPGGNVPGPFSTFPIQIEMLLAPYLLDRSVYFESVKELFELIKHSDKVIADIECAKSEYSGAHHSDSSLITIIPSSAIIQPGNCHLKGYNSRRN